PATAQPAHSGDSGHPFRPKANRQSDRKRTRSERSDATTYSVVRWSVEAAVTSLRKHIRRRVGGSVGNPERVVQGLWAGRWQDVPRLVGLGCLSTGRRFPQPLSQTEPSVRSWAAGTARPGPRLMPPRREPPVADEGAGEAAPSGSRARIDGPFTAMRWP